MTTEIISNGQTQTEKPKPANRRRQTAKPAAVYTSHTAGDKSYSVKPEILKQIQTAYPFLFSFLAAEKYDAAREIKIFISHTVKNAETGKTARITNFFHYNGTNKTKKFTKPAQTVFGIAAAVKRYPVLKPVSNLTEPIIYITVNALNSFRFNFTYKL